MERLAIEINGAGLLVTDGERILADEPGYAIIDDGQIVTGAAAWAQARLKPARMRSGFWSGLRVDGTSADSSGELAFEHLQHVWKLVDRRDASAVFVVPGGYDEQQLGLVLGIAQECGINVEALVDAGVAGSSLRYHDRELLYIDASLRTVTVSRILQSGEAAVERFETSNATGLAAFSDEMAKAIARCFVLDTRFDPLHGAATEQALYDGLPGWLEALHAHGSVRAELEHAGESLAVELTTERVRSASLRLFREIAQLIGALSSPGVVTVVQLNSRLARLPGLCAELARIHGTEVVSLEHGAPAKSALQRVRPRAAASGEVRLLRRLPFSGEVQPVRAAPPAAAPVLRPTHVVHAGVGYRLGSGRIEIYGGRDEGTSANGVRRMAIEALGAGGPVCVLDNGTSGLQIAPAAGVQVFVNDEPLESERGLEAGDVIRVGDGGRTLQIVSVEP